MGVDYTGMIEDLKGDLKKASDKNKRSEEQAKKTSELKRCPFCGGNNVSLWYNRPVSPLLPTTCEVHCYDCHFGLAPSRTKEEATKAWNNRKPLERVIERLEDNSFWTEATFDEDGYCNDDSEKVIGLYVAIEIIKQELM